MSDLDRWVGIDEVGGVPSQPRADLRPPAGWRLDAVAATERARSLAVAPDGARLAFVLDRDGSSDIWSSALDANGLPLRLTTHRSPMPYWEDTELAWSPDGTRLAYGDDGRVMVVDAAGGVPRRVAEGSGPVWVDAASLLAVVERDRRSVIVRLDLADPWPSPAAQHPTGDAYAPVVSPDRRHVAFTVWRHDVERCRQLWVASLDGGGDPNGRRFVDLPGLLDGHVVWSPDSSTIAYTAQTGEWTEVRVADVVGGTDRTLTRVEADLGPLAWNADGSAILTCRTRHGRSDLAVIDVAAGELRVIATGGVWSEPKWAGADVIAGFEDHRTPPRVERIERASGARSVVMAPTPAAVLTAAHVTPTEVTYRAPDGREIHGFLYRPAVAPDSPDGVPAVVWVHGGPAACSGDEWGGVAQYFVAKGYAWFEINFRGSTGYGRGHEHANHGDWGGGDVTDVLAAHDALVAERWIDPRRVAVGGPSYGSYLALAAVATDPQHRFAAAICQYGDCDILTSWAQGDRSGVLEQVWMLGPPHGANRVVYERGSPFHSLEQVEVPVLVAHGERDERVSPKQAAQHVAGLRALGKRYEYVTYPTEGHGFLRSGPFLDFWRRVERFLDWHLM